MSQITVVDRNLHSLFIILLFVGGSVVLVSAPLLPEARPMFVFGVVISLLELFIHFRQPGSHLKLLALDDGMLTMTS